MRKYWLVFVNTLLTRLEYRSDLIGTVITDLVPIIGSVWLWTAVFRTNSAIAGFSASDTIGYFLVLPLVGFISRCDLSKFFGYQIRKGEFSNFLVKPINARIYMLAYALGTKIGYLILVLPIYFLFLFLLSNYSITIPLSNSALFGGIIFSIISFLLQFIMETSIVNLAFWMDEVWSLVHFKNILISVFGGIDFPLNFLSKSLYQLFSFLPFHLLYFTPVLLITGKLSLIQNIYSNGLFYLIWTGILILISGITWNKGVKKYGAYGN